MGFSGRTGNRGNSTIVPVWNMCGKFLEKKVQMCAARRLTCIIAHVQRNGFNAASDVQFERGAVIQNCRESAPTMVRVPSDSKSSTVLPSTV